MGRQAYITKLALGRSSLLPSDDSHVAGQDPEDYYGKPSGQLTPTEHVQKYDRKGRPTNPLSTANKHRQVHAQNDVLATVGLCAKVNEKTPRREQALDEQVLRTCDAENDSGLELRILDSMLAALLESPATNLRQRIQTFRWLSDIPSSVIVRSDWHSWRPARFLFAGIPARWVHGLCEVLCDETFPFLFSQDKLHSLAFSEKYGFGKRLFGKFCMGALKTLEITFRIMLAPLEVYGTMQTLGIASTWPPLPDPKTLMKILTGLLCISNQPGERFAWFSLSQWLSFSGKPLPVWVVIAITKPVISGKLYHYFRAGLPKPTNPDTCSILAGQGTRVPGLRDEDKVNGYEIASVWDLLARDLQTIGRLWQISCDRIAPTISASKERLLRLSITASMPTAQKSETQPSGASTVQGLPDDLPDAMEASPAADVGLPRSENVLGLRPELQDLLDPMPENRLREDGPSQRTIGRSSSPLALLVGITTPPADLPAATAGETPSNEIAEAAPTQHEGRSPVHPESASTSPAESRAPTPPPSIEITSSTADTGAVHVNLVIPTVISEVEHIQGFHPPTPSDTSSEHGVVDVPQRPHNHRVTCLSTQAADSMAEHLSNRFADLIFLPLEALFVRAVARTFWSAPGLVISTRGAGGRWKDDVLPLDGWFGMGLRAGGLGPASGYAAKMLLVWGVQVGMNFIGWELTTSLVWWAGRRYYGWSSL